MDFMALTANPNDTDPPRFGGYLDANARFVSFAMADEVFERAHTIGARVLLRLELDDDGTLTGSMYTNERGVTPRQHASSV